MNLNLEHTDEVYWQNTFSCLRFLFDFHDFPQVDLSSLMIPLLILLLLKQFTSIPNCLCITFLVGIVFDKCRKKYKLYYMTEFAISVVRSSGLYVPQVTLYCS